MSDPATASTSSIAVTATTENEPKLDDTNNKAMDDAKGDDDDNNSKKRKKRPYANLKKKRKESATAHQAAIERKGGRKGGDEAISEKNTNPHDGSFAHPRMRELYDVSLPEDLPEESKVSKKKLAILMSYLGGKFAGFQINKEQRTVQAELELALYKAGLLQKSNFGFPHKYGWSTSGRTDKGVHACAQVVSAKLEMGELTEDEVRERINAQLHPDILVLDVKRTIRSFCAKTQRSRVRYQYMIPSYLFFPEAKKLFEDAGVVGTKNKFEDPLSAEEVQSLRPKLIDYRISSQQLTTLKSALALYVGTHAYHSFTKGMNPGDATAQRYILEFTADDPVIREDGSEWIPTQVLGQAFLLNQIRKMIAMACDVVCERATLQTVEEAFDKTKKMILPVAPAQGLFLDMSVYDHYNERKNKCSTDVEDLDWINQPNGPVMQRWKQFKDDVLLKKIVEEEAQDGNFIKYLYSQTNVFEWEEKYGIGDTTKEE
jgi:tRNA pseudouridine38-40 synthase